MSRLPKASLFGKLPSILDYVRVHHASDAGIAYDEWLEHCQHELLRANASWPKATHRFVFVSPSAQAALIGVVAPSKDRAGRKFPLTVYAEVPRASFASALLLPQGWTAFFADADALLCEAQVLKGDELTNRVLEVVLPSDGDLSEQRAARLASLKQRSLGEFVGSAFRGGSPDTVRAAMRRFLAGFEAGAGSLDRFPVLDCPVGSEQDVGLWLTLAERKLAAGSRVPWCFWTLEPGHERLLLGLGTPPNSLPVWLSGSKSRSDRLWTLTPTPPPEPLADAPAEVPPAGPNLEQVLTDALLSGVA